jgi:hypothetical protein
MAEQSYFLKHLYPTVEKNLSNKQTVHQLKQDIGRFMDRNNEKLTAMGPMSIIVFSDDDKNKLFHAIGFTEAELKDAIKNNPNIKNHWVSTTKPIYTASTLAIRYFTAHNNKEMVNSSLMYFAMSMYPLIFSHFFRYEPNKQIMNYTINNLSNKFKIKKLGTLYAAIFETIQGSYNLHKNRIMKGTDEDFVMFINDVNTRLRMFIRKISNEFYKNHEQKLYLNSDSDNYDEDNYHEADSNSYAIERLTNNVTLKLTVQGPEMRLVNLAAKSSQVSVNELRNYVNTMVTNEHRDDIRKIVESILFLYLFDSQNTIHDVYKNNKFLLYCLETYKKSNTTDKNIIAIKAILDKWLEDLGTYKKTQRLATINNFRRALFLFFVFSIQTTSN